MTSPHGLYELAQVAEQERMNEALRHAAVRAARQAAGPSRSRVLLTKLFRSRTAARSTATQANGHRANAECTTDAA